MIAARILTVCGVALWLGYDVRRSFCRARETWAEGTRLKRENERKRAELAVLRGDR